MNSGRARWAGPADNAPVVIHPHTTSLRRRVLQDPRCRRGLTLIELAVALGIVAVLSAIALPSWGQYQQRVKVAQARQEIVQMAAVLSRYWDDARAYPDSLAQVGLGNRRDPWGNAYQYTNLGDAGTRGRARKDHSLVPINTDFDLYSLGADGRSAPPLTAQMSRDDIVRANNGAFVGLASEY